MEETKTRATKMKANKKHQRNVQQHFVTDAYEGTDRWTAGADY